MAPRKNNLPKTLTPREAADYTKDLLIGLERLAKNNSQDLLGHLLEMARREAAWLSKK